MDAHSCIVRPLSCLIALAYTIVPASGDERAGTSIEFQLAAIELGIDYLPAETRKARQFDFPGPSVALKYQFLGELDVSVLDASDLRIKKVVLANGIQLDDDRIRMDGKTFRGQLFTAGDHWGIKLARDGRHVMIDVEIDSDRPTELGLVVGTFDVWRGTDDETIETDVLQDQKGSKENTLGVVVQTTMRWGTSERYLGVIAPIEHKSIKDVEVLDEDGTVLKLSDAFGYQTVRWTDKSSLLKLYVAKADGAPFRLRITRSRKLRTVTIPFQIRDVSVGR